MEGLYCIFKMWPFMKTGLGKSEDSDLQFLALSLVKVTKVTKTFYV